MSSWLSPLALKELLAPARGDDITPAALACVGLAGVLGLTWVVAHPLMLSVRHAPLALACALTLVQQLASVQRARLVLEERAAGTYETLILAGASGSRFVAGMIQASVLKGLQPLALALPVFAAAASALGTSLGTIAGFYAVLLAQLVLASGLGVLAASEPPSATGRRASGVTAGFRLSAAGYLLPVLSLAFLIPTVFIAVRGPSTGALANALGDVVYLPLLFCAPAVFAVERIHVAGFAVPFIPFAVLANLAAAAVPFARAAARHRMHRHDATQVRRALTAGTFVVTLTLTAAALPPESRGPLALALITAVELGLMLAVAPDATAPAWPATGPDDTPGSGRFTDLFRERTSTGLAFTSLLALVAAPYFAWSAPLHSHIAALAWGYTTVVALCWAMISYELPTPEPVARTGLGLRAAVLLLSAISLATVLWDETLLERQSALLVMPIRLILGAVVLSTPLAGALGLTAMMTALPVIRRGNLAGAALICRTTPQNLLVLSLAWHGVVAVLAWLWNRRARLR